VKSHGWHPLEVNYENLPQHVVDQFNESQTKFYGKGECKVIVSYEQPTPNDANMRWHLSISCQDRYPTWEEIKDARYSLLPMGLTFAQLLPPMDQFINIHPNCFHLWEIEWHG
jgi:hypothetical protein